VAQFEEVRADKFQTYVEANRDRFIAELQEFSRQPSVAAQNLGMREMADKVLARLKKLGADARLIEVEGGAPVVYGEIGSGPRTLMIYAHYDVQPPEQVEACLREVILPATQAEQATTYRMLKLRARTLTLVVIMAFVLSLIWRQAEQAKCHLPAKI